MPILAAQPDLHPETLFDADAAGRGWWVAQTKPRQEKRLARELRDAELAYYLPCQLRRNRVRGRIVMSQIPLFSGYLFLPGDGAERNRLLATGRIVRLLNVTDPDRLVADLKQVRFLTGLGLPLEPLDLRPGHAVRIRRGPMSGLSGRVLRGAGKCRFVVAVEFLGQGVAVELEEDDLAAEPKRGGPPR
jgi:transcriptional antiterminator RfaH